MDKFEKVNINIICVDNLSTDNSLQICQNLKKNLSYTGIYSKISFQIINCPIIGLAPARNSAIYYSFLTECDFIANLDSDDIWLPDKLEKQINYLNNHPECDIIGTQISYIDAHGKIFNHSNYPIDNKEIKEHIKKGINPIANSSSIIRKDVFLKCGSYDPTYNLCEDFHLWVRASQWFNFHNIDERLTLYRFIGPRPDYVPMCGPICAKHFFDSISYFHNKP